MQRRCQVCFSPAHAFRRNRRRHILNTCWFWYNTVSFPPAHNAARRAACTFTWGCLGFDRKS